MALRLSARNKVFIAGIAGAVALSIGFYVLTAGLSVRGNALGPRFSGGEKAAEIGGFYLAFAGLVLLAASGLATGALYAALAQVERLASGIALSMAAGAAAGLLVFLLASMATLVSALGMGPARALSGMLMDAFYVAPVFVLIMLLLALFAAAGAVAYHLSRHAIGKLRVRIGG